MGDQPVANPLPTQDNTNTHETRTDIHISSGIRTQDPSPELLGFWTFSI
jgi:hypothetical protein